MGRVHNAEKYNAVNKNSRRVEKGAGIAWTDQWECQVTLGCLPNSESNLEITEYEQNESLERAGMVVVARKSRRRYRHHWGRCLLRQVSTHRCRSA